MKKFYLVVFLTFASSLAFADPGTAFTYQGRLANGSAPIETGVDLRFSLWDSDSSGAQVGSDITVLNTAYDGGIVQTELDFGSGAFDGEPRWLEIEVADPAGGSFSALSNRVEIQPTPYAIFATTAESVEGGVAANRIAIDSLPFDITASGSYYLAASLSAAGGITINADDATLDLNGFRITNTAGDGISAGAFSGICIKNGIVRGCLNDGIDVSSATNVLIQNVKVLANTDTGIRAANEAEIIDCTVNENLEHGIIVVDDCIVRNNNLARNSNNNAEVGLYVTGGNNIVEYNRVLDGRRGLQVDGTDNFIKGNFCKGASNTITISGFAYRANVVIQSEGNQLDLLIAEIPFGMEYSGRARLTGDLTSTATSRPGIIIVSDNVTIDLNGFALIGSGAGGTTGTYSASLGLDDPPDTTGTTSSTRDGIKINGQYGDIVIKNGTIRNWGGDGIDGSLGVRNSLFENLILTGNDRDGLVINESCIVKNCVSRLNGIAGFDIGNANIIVNCTAEYNGDSGFDMATDNTIKDSTANFNEDDGVLGSNDNTVIACTANGNLDDGFDINANSSISNSTASENSGNGFEIGLNSVVKACSSEDNGAIGFDMVGIGVSLSNCTASSNALGGIDTGVANLVTDCVVYDNGNDTEDNGSSSGEDFGIRANADCVIRNCVVDNNGSTAVSYNEDVDGAGILITGGDTKIENNSATDNRIGIRVLTSGNLIIKNSASGNTTNYDIDTNNSYGPIVDVAGVGNISSTTDADHPWANFEF